MKEIIYDGIAELLQAFGLDGQKCVPTLRFLEDVAANFQIFSAYAFGFYVLAIFDHFGSI